MLGTYLKLITYYKVNGNDLRLRSEVMAVHFDQVTAEVTVRPGVYKGIVYGTVPYNTVGYGYGRIVTGYGRSPVRRQRHSSQQSLSPDPRHKVQGEGRVGFPIKARKARTARIEKLGWLGQLGQES